MTKQQREVEMYEEFIFDEDEQVALQVEFNQEELCV